MCGVIDPMGLAVEQARKTMNENIGGPFGAAIVKDGKIIAVNSNRVLKDHDPRSQRSGKHVKN